jgi:orotidine-5'-phosphate decarboxylase
LDALAHIDLTRGVAFPLSEMLDDMAARDFSGMEAEYIIISAYYGADLEEAYNRLLERYGRAAWILPCTRGMRLDKGDIRESLRERVILV